MNTPTPHDEAQPLARLAAEWRAGWLTGNVELLLSLYADDAVLLPQDHPAVHGKDAIRSLYALALDQYAFVSEGKLVETVVSGDWGYLWSTYTLTATPRSAGPPVRSSGKSIFIVKRQPDGAWRIARLMDNADSPSAIPAETR